MKKAYKMTKIEKNGENDRIWQPGGALTFDLRHPK